jgi:hypothetical protein
MQDAEEMEESIQNEDLALETIFSRWVSISMVCG